MKGRKWSRKHRAKYNATMEARRSQKWRKESREVTYAEATLKPGVPEKTVEDLLDFLWNRLDLEFKLRLFHNEIQLTGGGDV